MAINEATAKHVILKFLQDFPGAQSLVYRFCENIEELYQHDAGAKPQVPTNTKGVYLSKLEVRNGKIYSGRVDVVMHNTDDESDLLETLRHEVIGHYGMNTFSPEDRRTLLDALLVTRQSAEIKPLWDEVASAYANKTLDEQAEEVWSIYCEGVPFHWFTDDEHVRERGEQSFKETCVDRSRPMRLDDLHSIACMVAQGLYDRSRVQQTFPQLPEHRLSIAHDEEPPRPLDFGNRSLDELAQEYAAMDGTDGGHLIDVDRIRELSPEYRADRSRANDIHAAASKFSQQLYEHALAQPVGEGGRRPVVVFTAGGSGSGKSTAIGKLLGAGNADITLDGTFSKLNKARNRVQAALDSGRDVEIRYVFRAPEKAAETAIGRAIRHGRPAPVSVMAENHVQALQTVRAIAKNFKGDKRVMIIAIDNNGDKADDAYITDITKIPEVHYDDAKRKFETAIDATWRQQQRAVHENAAASFGRGTQSPGAQTPPDRHVDAGRGSVDGGTTRLERATIPGSPESGGEGRDRDAVTPTLTPELYKAFMGHEPPAQRQVSAVQDAAYMDAVERGDMETARQMVRDAFRAAFPKTTIVDESGDPLVVFHSYEGDAPHYGNERVWLSANREFSAEFGENTDEVFVNLENPYIVEDYFRDADGNVIILEDGYPAEIGFLAAAPYEYRAWLRENYDGVMDDCKEFIVAFDALQQVKYADPVTYDDDGNVIPLSQRIDARFSFAGERGAQSLDAAEEVTHRMDNLAVAREMEAAGKNAKTVKLATGWERGKDGKWRYEFEDDYYHPRKIVDALTAEWKKKQSVLYKQEREVYDKFVRLEGQIPARLGKKFSEEEKTKFREMRKELKAYWQQYMELSRARSDVELHPEFSTTLEKTLFADNPLLKAHPELADIKVQAGALPFGVRGAYNYETRTITLDSALPLEQFPSVLAHEVQHTIQHVEGFARGGNSKQFDGKELDAERVRSEADAARKQGDIAQAEKLELLADEIDENALNGQIEIDGHMYENAFEAYRALAGETEARNVQTRMGMTLEERRNSLAEETEDVARADQIVLHELMDKAETTGAAFSFTGERGAQSLDAAEEVTHRMDNLAVAREMEQAGKDAKAVKLATGWERGKDGKWRYELDDSQVEVDLFVASLGSARNPEYLRLRRLNEKYANYTLGNSEDVFTAEDEAEFQRLKNSEVGRAYAAATENGYKKLRAGEAVPLSDVMYAPELFNAYPQLEYVKVRVGEPYNAGADAEVNIGKEGIVITVKQSLAYGDKARSPLLHEVQHVIQHMEGFAQGASPINMPPELVEHFNRERTERYVEAGERLDEAAAENGISRFDALAEGFQATDLRLANAITDFRNAQGAMLAGSHFEAYRRTAGETEARNVQTRMGMTLEERRNSLAEETEDVARADQIVLRELMDRAESRAAAALNAPKFKRTVWHASPYGGIEKEGFKMHAIGTGEGAQVFGWGIYMAGARATAVDNYRQALANRHIVNPDLHQGKDGKQGQVYRLQIPVAHKDLLDYDAPLAEQPKKVREALDGILQSTGDLFGEDAGFWENARAHLILNECSTLVDKSNLLKAVDRNGEYVAPVYILKFTGEADADIEMAKRWAARTLVDARLYDEDVRHKYVASMREHLLAAARNHGVDGELPLANAFDRALEELSLKELQGWNFSLFGRRVSVAPTKEPFGHSPPEVIVVPSCTTLENAVDVALRAYKQDILPTLTGGEFYEGLAAVCHDARGASEKLLKTGIPGLRYLDAVSREQDEGGTYNYVIWDESLLTPEAANIRALFSRSNMRESMNDNTESNRIYGNHENTNPVRMLYAAGDGDIDAVRAYISAGGDVNAIDKAPVYTSAIIQAAEYGHAEIVRLLIEHGADVNTTKTGATALMLAAATGRAEIVNMLLEAGADIAHKDYTNKQALHYAAQFGRTDIARALIDAGADIEAVDRKGSTALMFAAGNGYIETARLLIERGANINARTEYGRTPLMVAALDDAAPASAEDQAAAEMLNQSLARQFSNPAWQNAYQATALPSELAGLRAEFQAAFGRTIRPVLPTSPEFDCYGGVYLPEHPGEIFVNLRQQVDFLQLAGHEMLHDIKRTRPDLYNWFIEQADSYLVNVEDYRERLNRLATATGEKPHTLQSAKEELIADFCGDALADVKFCGQLAASDSNRFTGLLHHVTAWLGKLGDKLRGMDSSRHVKDVDGLRKHLSDALVAYAKGEKLEDMPSYRQAKAEAFDTPVASVETRETDKGVALFSQKPPKLSEEERAERGREYGRRILAGAAQWEKVVDKAWNIKDAKEQQGSPLKMGHTPDILVEVGLPDLDLYMTTGVMHKITDDKHHLTKEQVKALYAELADPVAVIRDEQGRHAAVTTLREGDDPVIVGLLTDYPQGDKKGGGRLLVNRVTSAYGKQSFFGYMLKHAREGNVLYLDKKRLADLVDAPSAGDPTDATSLRLRGRIFQRFQQALRGRVKQPSHVVKPIFDAAEAREIDEDRAREVLPEMRNARTSSNRAKRAGVQFPGQNPMKSGHNVILTERGDAPLDQQPIPQTEDLAERQRIEAQQLKDFEAQQREEQAQSAGDEDGVKFSIRAGSAAGSIDLLAVKEKFAEDAREIGLIIDDPIADGQFHRVPVEGCKRGKLPGSYFLRMDGHCPGGFFNNFMIGVSKKWSARSMMQDAPSLTRQERQEMNKAIAEKQAQDAREQAQQYETVAQFIARKFPTCPPVQGATPYMRAKGICWHDGVLGGVRTNVDGQKTIIVIHDENGKPWSTQTIHPDGAKIFFKGGKISGCFHAVGGMNALGKAPSIVIAEGYATAASLAEVLEQPTVAALNAGNLKPVAEALRRKYPDKIIVIAGDDDFRQEAKNGCNPGREKAQAAAEAVGGVAVFPKFAPGEQEREGFTDFNDLAVKSTIGVLGCRHQILHAVSQARYAATHPDEVAQQPRQRVPEPIRMCG